MGRFPLGAGQEGFVNPTELRVSGGEDTVTLSADHLPDHRHEYEDFFYLQEQRSANSRNVLTRDILGSTYGSEGSDENNIGWYRVAETMPLSYGGQAHNNMPPFHTVLYCQFTGEKHTPTLPSAESVE
jgi:microcystin-dependent protein